jgi:hypothetical protein
LENLKIGKQICCFIEYLSNVLFSVCPNGTYSLGLVPGDVSVCVPCPDLNHVTVGPAISVQDCQCKKGFVSNGDQCKGKKQNPFCFLVACRECQK